MKKCKLTNDIQQVPQLAEWVDEVCMEAGLSPERTFQINLALEEAVVNVMQYAYPGQVGMPVEVSAHLMPDMLTFTIEDEGAPFDPTKTEDPDITLSAEEREIGGLGIMLVKNFMDNVDYERQGGKNILKLSIKR